MKILLAGGGGYIGSALAPVLVEHGYDVHVIDLLWFGNHLSKSVKSVKKDLFSCVAGDFEGVDLVIFLAGISNDPMAEHDPAANFTGNAALPAFLAFTAKKAGVKRFIYASSCSVYGYTVNRLYDETSPVTCAYPYGISKLQGENGVFQMQDERFSVISLRQGTVSGHSPRMRMDLIVNTMYKTAMTEGRVIVSNPSIWRPVYDMRDAVSAFLRAIQSDLSVSGVFNVSSGNFTVGQVTDMVKEEVEKLTGKRIKIEINNSLDYRNYKVSVGKAETHLGFKPQHTIQDIVLDLHEHRGLYGDFDREEFYNIRVFKKLART